MIGVRSEEKKDKREGGEVNNRGGQGDLKRAVKPTFSIIHFEINTTPVQQQQWRQRRRGRLKKER